MSTYRGVNTRLALCLNSVLNVKAVVALVGAFFVIIYHRRLIVYTSLHCPHHVRRRGLLRRLLQRDHAAPVLGLQPAHSGQGTQGVRHRVARGVLRVRGELIPHLEIAYMYYLVLVRLYYILGHVY